MSLSIVPVLNTVTYIITNYKEYVTKFWKMVPNHTAIITMSYIYHCHINSVTYIFQDNS